MFSVSAILLFEKGRFDLKEKKSVQFAIRVTMNPAPVDPEPKSSKSGKKSSRLKKTLPNGGLCLSGKQQKVSPFEHLPVEIIERILMKLNLGDLASVAGTNAYLRGIANNVFIRCNADKELELNIDSRRKHENGFTKAIDAIRILYRFGPFINRLKIRMENDFSPNQHSVMDAISYFCADYLRELKIGNIRETFKFNTKFIKMEILTIQQSRMAVRRMAEFNEWFPNLKRLNFGNVSFIGLKIEH